MPEIHPSTHLRAPDPRTAATRRRIIDTSLRLFAEHGFRGVSVRDISTAAQVNVAAVNYHFGGKQGLYRTIFETVLDDDEARFAEQLATVARLLGHTAVDRTQLPAAVEILAGGMVKRISTYENFRWFSVLLARELAFPGDLFELLYRRRAAPLLDLLARVVGAAQGLAPEAESVRLTANVLYGQVGHLVFSRPILWRQVDWEDYTPARLDLLTRTVIDLINRAIGLESQDHPRADPGVVI